MTWSFGGALLVPLLAAIPYRRDTGRWAPAVAYAALALLLSFLGAVIAGLSYGYAVATEAGLCGDDPWEAGLAGLVAYLVVASWATRGTRRVWAWAPAAAAGIAVAIFVSYFFARAHGYCET